MPDADEIAGRRAWVLAGWLWLAVTPIAASEIAPASVLRPAAADLGGTQVGASWLVSGFLLGMVVFSLLAGSVLDRRDDRGVFMLMAGAFLLSAGWATLAGQSGAYGSLVAARFVDGAVNIVLWTAAVNVVGAAFALGRQGTGLGFLLTSVLAGFAVAHVLTPVMRAPSAGRRRSPSTASGPSPRPVASGSTRRDSGSGPRR